MRFRVNLHCATIVPLLSLKNSDIAPVSSKEILDTRATIERRFNLKRVRYMILTYGQMHRIDMYS